MIEKCTVLIMALIEDVKAVILGIN